MSNETGASAPNEAPASNAASAPEVEVLRKASEGLNFLSETDAPFTPFFWPGEETAVAPELVASQTGRAVGDISSKSLDALFKPFVTEQDWQNSEEKAEVQRFQTLLSTLKSTLKHPKAFRIGKVEIDIYIVGGVPGGVAGLQTKAVET